MTSITLNKVTTRLLTIHCFGFGKNFKLISVYLRNPYPNEKWYSIKKNQHFMFASKIVKNKAATDIRCYHIVVIGLLEIKYFNGDTQKP